MITLIAIAAALILMILAILHVAWGFGSTWPDADSQSLARRVAGFKGIRQMPRPAACFFVAAVLAFAALIALTAVGVLPTSYPHWLILTALSAIAAVFTLRGLLAYTSQWRERTPEEPFASLDRRIYGPLCLIIGSALTLIVFTQNA